MLHHFMTTLPDKYATGTDMSAATGGASTQTAPASESPSLHETPPASDSSVTAPSQVSSSDVAPATPTERLDVSPSLVRRVRGGPVAYEWKFVVDELTARRIEDLLRDSLTIDPHADDRGGGAYLVTTVYFDTPQWDVLRGLGRHKLQKYRLRRYGESGEFFGERKAKRGKQVRKRRDALAGGRVDELKRGARGDEARNDGAAGHWFARQLARQGLSPICRVQYSRRAYFGATEEGRVRLTFDRALRGAPVDGWSLRTTRDDAPILVDRVICEFKFAGTMPSLFKRVIQELQLEATGFSKYRNGMRVFGLGPTAPANPDSAAPVTAPASEPPVSGSAHA